MGVGADKPFISTRILDLNKDDMPREKALAQGVRALSDAELIAIIFGGGLPGLSVVDMARGILRDCDNRVDFLARLSMNELMSKYKGIGPAKAVSLAAAFELGRSAYGFEIDRNFYQRAKEEMLVFDKEDQMNLFDFIGF